MASEWKRVPIADVVEIISGGTPKTSVFDYWGGDIPWLSVSDFNTGYRWVSDAEKHITERGLSESATTLLKHGDIIISARGTVGALAQLANPMAFNQSCYGLRAKCGIAENDFLFYLLRQTVSKMKQVAHGGVFDTITRDTFSIIEVSIPPLPEQRTIAHILGTLDDKIELNRRMNRTLEEMARAIFKSWFVDFDPVRAKMEGRWRKGESLSGLPANLWDVFPDKLVDSELGPIPEGWEVGALNTIASLETKAVIPGDSANQLWEHFSIPAFDNGRQPVREKGESIKSGKYLVPSCCVLASKLNPQFPRVWLPDIPNPEVSICSTEFMPFVPKTESEQPFLYAFLSSEVAQAEIINRVTGSTSSRQRVKPKEIAEMPMLVPPQALRQRFSSVTRHYLARLLKNMRSITTLAAIRDTLLPKLISGELRVPDAERIVGGSV